MGKSSYRRVEVRGSRPWGRPRRKRPRSQRRSRKNCRQGPPRRPRNPRLSPRPSNCRPRLLPKSSGSERTLLFGVFLLANADSDRHHSEIRPTIVSPEPSASNRIPASSSATKTSATLTPTASASPSAPGSTTPTTSASKSAASRSSRKTTSSASRPDNTGNIPLYLSGFNTQLGREDSAIIADPIQQFGGAIKIRNDLNLWGTEVNALFNIRRSERFEWTLLSGLRYMEPRGISFSLSAVSRDLILNQQITLDDRFETTNQFLGYQLGTRMSWRYKRFLFDLTGKVALGGNEQTRSISGQSTSSGPDATNPGTFPGGFYAQPSNMGKNSDLQLAVMPALEMKLGFNITSGILFTVGYDLFYLNQTVRVANQIDRNLNLSQSRRPRHRDARRSADAAAGSTTHPIFWCKVGSASASRFVY